MNGNREQNDLHRNGATELTLRFASGATSSWRIKHVAQQNTFLSSGDYCRCSGDADGACSKFLHRRLGRFNVG
jgi:hypothetical protein